MKKRLPLILAIALAVIAVIVWRWRSGGALEAPPTAATGSSARGSATTGKSRVVAASPRPDPKTLGRGSIAGTITIDDATKAPIASAQVCAYGKSNVLATELLRQPTCVTTDAQGHYTIANLLPAEYRVGANAKTYRPAIYHPDGDRKRVAVFIAANQAKTGVDLALRTGGVEITGSVLDLTGGIVAHAHVWSGEGRERILGSTETDDLGRFSMWVAPDYASIHATADGYDDNEKWVDPPAKDIEIVLTPESTLAGKVIDAASGEPVEGARVQLGEWDGSDSTFSDAEGKFRLGKLAPSRYVIIARTDRAYGRTEGSALVGLGQNVDTVIVKLFPAVRVSGKVVIAATKKPCLEPEVGMNDNKTERWVSFRRDPDGSVWAEGVLPGDYEPSISCRGYQARDKYDRITVTSTDVKDLVWEVDAGATIRGKVLARSGKPVEGANLWARTTGGAARARTGWGGDESARDGSYALEGLKAGTYKIEVSSDEGVGPKDGYKVEVAAGATVEKDVILEDVGTIKGVVVDANGKPVTKIRASAYLVGGGGRGWGDREVDDAGAFTLEGLRPGEYRVTAQRSWSDSLRKPGANDDAKLGEKVVVKASQVATVRLVVEALSGRIKGTVVDTSGQPVTDAFIAAARESDAAGSQKSSVGESRWQWDEKPVLTAVDGTFVVEKLAPGNYTVRAYRRGGGEAIAEHVPVDGTAKLQIKPTGSIRGVAKVASGGKTLAEIEVSLHDRKSGFWRTEGFYMTDGLFVIEDLPKGHFDLTVKAAGSSKTLELDLAEGETKADLTIELEGALTLRGRVVDQGTNKPVAGMRMMASSIVGSSSFGDWGGEDEPNVSDESGAFVIEQAPRGRVRLRGYHKDWNDSDYSMVEALRVPAENGDLGDIPVFKKRVKRGDAVGELGIHFADQSDDTLPDQRELKVSWIDASGPAAKVDLKVGDIVTTIDGIDVAGANNANSWSLMRAAPGTKLTLGLARGASVTIILAPP